MRERLSVRIVVAYGLPGFIAAVPVIPIAVLLPSRYASDLGLGFFVTGLVLGIARLVDFASDIIIGQLTDRFDWRGYRYKPLVIGGALVASVGLVALAVPGEHVSPWWLASWSVVLFTGWTLLMVPYTAWGAELSDDYHDRSRLTASREVAGLIGMLLALVVPALATNFGNIAFNPLFALAITTIAIGIPLIAGFAYLVPEPIAATSSEAIRFADTTALVRLPAFRRTLSCWWLNGVANGLPAVLFPVVVETYFGLTESALFVLLLCYFGAAVFGVPLWLWLSRRCGKTKAWRVAIAVNIVVFAQVMHIDAANAFAFGVICFLSGLSLGADLALPPSIQADILEGDRRASGRRRTASAFALWSMATKLALACAVFVGFAGLELGNSGIPDTAPTNLLLLYVALPVAIKLLVFFRLSSVAADDLFDANPAAN